MVENTEKSKNATAAGKQATAAENEETFKQELVAAIPHLRAFARSLCNDPSQADDLAQECFLHAWDKLQTYSGRGSFIGWLLKVAYTTFLQSKRKSKRYREILEQAGHEADRAPAAARSAPETELDLDTLLAALNEQESALRWLERGLAVGALGVFYKDEPVWDTLRREQRFADLLRKMGVPQ